MNNDGLEIALQMKREMDAGIDPTVSQLPIKGSQLNEIKNTSSGLGIDSTDLMANPEALPNAKQNLAIKNITKKSPELGAHLSAPEKQATWWDKLQAIDSNLSTFVSPSIIGMAKFAVKHAFNDEEKKHIQSSQTGRALSMADFAVTGTKTYLEESGLSKVTDNKIFKQMFNADVTKSVADTQENILNLKDEAKQGLMRDPNLAVRTADGISTALSYMGIGYLTGGQGIIPMGIAEGGGMGVEAGREAGLSELEQTRLGVVMGGVTALSERASFGFGKYLGASSVGQTVLRNAVARNTAKMLASGATEQFEENVEAFGHVQAQQLFGMDAEFAFETDPSIFLTGMFMHAGHRTAQMLQRTQVANQLSTHLDSSIAFADKVDVGVAGALSDMINARDKGLTMTFDAIELDVALEKDADTRAKVIALVGEQEYNDKVARGDKIEVSIGDYVEYLREGDSTLRGVAEYENTKLKASMSEEQQEKAINDLFSYADMQMFVNNTMSDGVAETQTYSQLYDIFSQRMRDSGAHNNRADIQHTHADFFARLASQFADMAQRQFEIGTDENKGQFDAVEFIKDFLPMFEQGVNAGSQGREIIGALNTFLSEGKTSQEMKKGLTASQFLSGKGLEGASTNEELLKSFQLLNQAGYLQDTTIEEDAISMAKTAIESGALLPEGSESLNVFKQMGEYLERLEKLGVEVNQRYSQLFESLQTSDPTMNTEALNQLVVEFNNLHGLRERQLLEAQLGGQMKAQEKHSQMLKKGETHLEYSHWLKVRTPRFKAWFGDWENDKENSSKVIDKRTGEPLVIYHGSSSNYTFTEFQEHRLSIGKGFFASDKPEVSTTYTEGEAKVMLQAKPKGDGAIHYNLDANIYAGFLNIRDAGEYDFEGGFWTSYQSNEAYVPIKTHLGSIDDLFNKMPKFTDTEEARTWLMGELRERMTIIDFKGETFDNGEVKPLALGVKGDNGKVKFFKFMRGYSLEQLQSSLKNNLSTHAIDGFHLIFHVGEKTSKKSTNVLKDEDYKSGRDGSFFRTVVDTADGSPIVSDVFVFFNSNQFKHVDNNGAYSQKGDILRQMVRDDFRNEFIEAEARIGGRDAWLNSNTEMDYPNWVSSFTENYKNGMPSVVSPPETLFQSEKDFGELMFYNPVIRDVNNLPSKQFGTGDDAVATAKAWADKLKSMPVNKDFLNRTGVLDGLKYIQDKDKLSKNEIVTMMGVGWKITLDMATNSGYKINPQRPKAIVREGDIEEKELYESWSIDNPETQAEKDSHYVNAVARLNGFQASEIYSAIEFGLQIKGFADALNNTRGLDTSESMYHMTRGKPNVIVPDGLVLLADGKEVYQGFDSDGDVVVLTKEGRSSVLYKVSVNSSNEKQNTILADIIHRLKIPTIVVDRADGSWSELTYIFVNKSEQDRVIQLYKQETMANYSLDEYRGMGFNVSTQSQLVVGSIQTEESYAIARAYATGEAPYSIQDRVKFLTRGNTGDIDRLISHANATAKSAISKKIAGYIEHIMGNDTLLKEFIDMNLLTLNKINIGGDEALSNMKELYKRHGLIFLGYVSNAILSDGYITGGVTNIFEALQISPPRTDLAGLVSEVTRMNLYVPRQRQSQDEWADENVGFSTFDEYVDDKFGIIKDSYLRVLRRDWEDSSDDRAINHADYVQGEAQDSAQATYPDDENAETGSFTYTSDYTSEMKITFVRNDIGEDDDGNDKYEWVIDVSGDLYVGRIKRIDGNSYDSFEEMVDSLKDMEDELLERVAEVAYEEARDAYEDSDEWYEELGFSSEDEALEDRHPFHEIFDEAHQSAEDEYENAQKGFDDSVNSKMNVVWESYTDSAKGDDITRTGGFNIAMRIPSMPSRFRYDSHTSESDGYEENIIALVMGNFRDVVRPDGTVGHAMFVEEIQSDIQQKNREFWQFKKDPAKAVRSKVTAIPYGMFDWEEMAKNNPETIPFIERVIAKYEQKVDEYLTRANGDVDSIRALNGSSTYLDIMRSAFNEQKSLETIEVDGTFDNFNSYIEKTFSRVSAYLKATKGSVDIKLLKSITKRINTDLTTSGTEDYFYITQDNMPQEMMVKAIIQMTADPSFIESNKPVTDVVFGSARTVSIHNQSSQYTDELNVSISLNRILVNSRDTDLNNVGSYLGSDLVPVIDKYYATLLADPEMGTIDIKFQRNTDADLIGKKTSYDGYYMEDIGTSYDPSPVMQPTNPNNIGLINQYDKKNPKVIKSEVARMGGVVEEYRTVSDYSLGGSTGTLKLNDIPLLGYKLEPVQTRWSKDPESVRASLFQRDTLIEGAYNRQTRLIQIFNQDNTTTMMHEGAHWYLDTLSLLASNGGIKEAQEAITRLGTEFKFDPRTSVPEEAHERFARSFEQFLMEGEAPSRETSLTMGQMKEQFKRQYMLAKEVGQVSPEAREFFSRMIDSDEATAEQIAQPLFTAENAKLLGLTEPQMKAYLRNKAMELEESAGTTREKSMSLIEKRKEKQWKNDVKQQRDAILDEMSRGDMNYRDEKIFSYLTTGQMPNKGDIGIPHMRLSRAETVKLIGEEATASFPQNIFGKTQGIPAVSPEDDMLLSLFGYGNAQEMFDSIEAGVNFKQRVQAQAEAMADQLAEQESESLKAMAEAGAHHSKRAMNLKFEIDTLAKAMNTKPPSISSINSTVAFEVQSMSLDKITKERNRVLKAERKAGDEALKAMAKGDIPATLSAKTKELVNSIMFDQMVKAQETANKQTKWIKDKSKKKSYERIGKGGAIFVDAYESVLGYVGTVDKEKTKSMNKIVKDLTDSGNIIYATDTLIENISASDVRFIDEMTVSEVGEIYDLLKNIRSMASQMSNMLIDGKAMEVERIATTIAESAYENLSGKAPPLDPETMSVLEKANSYRKQAIADLYRLEAVAGWVDGEKSTGMFTSAVWNPLNEASDEKNKILREILDPLAKMSEKLIDVVGKSKMRQQYTMPWNDADGKPVKVTRQWMISFALNTGNATSLERIGNQFDQSQVSHILSQLTKDEFNYVQDVWDLLETLWDRIETLERKMTGVTPQKVERVPRIIRLSDGEIVKLQGGYFPLVYDKDSPQYIDTFGNDADQLLSKGVMPAGTSHGFTKSRAKTVNIPIKFDLTNIMSHIEEVAHDLSHREAIRNAWRIMNHPIVKESFVASGNIAMYQMIRAKIKQVAQSDSLDVQGLTAMKKLSRHLRSGISVSAMGLSTMTMTKQLIGLSQAVTRLGLTSDSSIDGFKYTAIGMADSLSRGHREQMIAESGLMKNRIDTVNLDVRRQMQRKLGRTMSLGKISDMASPLLWLKDRAFVPMAWVQYNFVDVPVYLGAKRLGARQGLYGTELVRFAEAMVRRSQGAGETKDTALVENVAFLELFIPFYSYASAYLNEQITILNKAGQYKRAKRLMLEAPTIATATTMLVMTPMIMDTLIAYALGKMDLPEDDGEEEYWKTLLKYFSVKFAFDAMTYGIPIVRDIGAMTARALNDEPQFNSPRGMDVVADNLQKLYKHAGNAVSEDEEVDGGKLAKDLATTTTVLTGIPLNKPYSHLDSYLYELENGDGDFGSPEFWLNFYGGSHNDREE